MPCIFYIYNIIYTYLLFLLLIYIYILILYYIILYYIILYYIIYIYIYIYIIIIIIIIIYFIYYYLYIHNLGHINILGQELMPLTASLSGPEHVARRDSRETSWFVSWWLVVWNMTFIFPNSWDDDPIWLSYFSEGLKSPTSLVFSGDIMLHTPMGHMIFNRWIWDPSVSDKPKCWGTRFCKGLSIENGWSFTLCRFLNSLWPVVMYRHVKYTVPILWY